MSTSIAPPAPEASRTAAWWQVRFALLAAVVAALLFAFAPRSDEAPSGPAPYLVGVFARQAGVVEPVVEEGVLAVGAELHFATWAAEARHVAVIVRDASGRAAVAFPPAGSAPARHGAGRGVPLPGATVTALVPGELQVNAYFCEKELELEPIRVALEAGGRPEPKGCSVDRLSVVVEAP